MDPAAADPLVWAARLCADPAGTIGRFKALTGRKAVGLFPPLVPFEVVEAAGMLAVAFFPRGGGDDGGRIAEGVAAMDAFAFPIRAADAPDGAEALTASVGEAAPRFRFRVPAGGGAGAGEDLVDAVEEFTEWASDISGRAVNEGDLHRAIRSANRRRRLWKRLSARVAESPGAFSAGELLALARSGVLLPADAHSGIVDAALSSRSGAGRRGEPRIFLAGVPDFAAAGAVDVAGAVVCGSDLAEEAALRGEEVAEEGDAAVSIARWVARESAGGGAGREPGAVPGRIRRLADESRAEAIVIFGGADERESTFDAGGAGAAGMPLFRVSGQGPADADALRRLRRFLEAVPRKGES